MTKLSERLRNTQVLYVNEVFIAEIEQLESDAEAYRQLLANPRAAICGLSQYVTEEAKKNE